MDASRREQKEMAVSGQTGTTFWEVQSVLAVWLGLELVTIVGPGCIATLWPETSAYWIALLGFAVFCSCAEFPAWRVASPEYLAGPRYRFVDAYRGLLLLLTCFAILAVDFPVFPKGFMKTEQYGFSLMDVGVGCLCVANGLVAGGRRGDSSRSPPSRFAVIIGACIPLLVLGFIRLATVKATSYPEHETEYGVHWNFFFTLATVMLADDLLRQAAAVVGFGDAWRLTASVGILLVAAHQVLLTRCGLAEYVMGPTREGLVGMNKEGIVSLPGYTGAYVFARAVGMVIRQQRVLCQQWYALAYDLVRLIVACSVLLLLCVEVLELQPSRRLCNAPYVLFVIAVTFTTLLLCLLIDLKVPSHGSQILEAVSGNMLPIFLLANVLTGCANLLIATESTGPLAAVGLLMLYMAGLCMAAVALQGVRLKWW